MLKVMEILNQVVSYMTNLLQFLKLTFSNNNNNNKYILINQILIYYVELNLGH